MEGSGRKLLPSEWLGLFLMLKLGEVQSRMYQHVRKLVPENVRHVDRKVDSLSVMDIACMLSSWYAGTLFRMLPEPLFSTASTDGIRRVGSLWCNSTIIRSLSEESCADEVSGA